MGFLYQFLYKNLAFSLFALFSPVSIYISPLFSFITTFFHSHRLKRTNGPLNKNSSLSDFSETEQQLYSATEDFKDVLECPVSEINEMEKTEFCFTFKFPTYEEFCKSKEEKGEFLSSELKPSTCNNKSPTEPEISGSGLENEELLDGEQVTSHSRPIRCESQILESMGFKSLMAKLNKPPTETELLCSSPDYEKLVDTDHSTSRNGPVASKFGLVGPMDFRHRKVKPKKSPTKTKVVETEDFEEGHSKNKVFNEEEKGNSDNFKCDEEEIEDSSCTDSDTVSICFEHMDYLMSKLVDSYSDDDFLTIEDFGDNENLFNVIEMTKENHECDDNDSDIMEELRKLEHDQEQRFLCEDDFHEDMDKVSNDSNKLESLWEHQELIEQLKVELRKVRDIGLPTILEESEGLKMEDLQPWKIEEKFQREDCMSELHKFYKSYRDRMRKFDILTYQKMYATGVLQKDTLKDPFQHVLSQRSSGPKLKSLVSHNIRLFKRESQESIDPMVKFIKELQSDLEVIYVGQMCLSWEILHWQYMKALSLWDSDPSGICTYNEVAGEFQQFQVLLQRFMENEPFEGPRIQYFITRRYDLRNLLQVPVIREDRKKDKTKTRALEKGEYAITSDMLVEILEEAIRIFWRFVRADRRCSSVMLKGQKRKHQELQSPGELELLLEVKKSLEKNEKRLKNALRGECYILRRFKKCKEDDSVHVLYFFSQVDMKLVVRVLNMAKLTTDQLVWCHNKLSKIIFLNRKIHVDPSFLLFPC